MNQSVASSNNPLSGVPPIVRASLTQDAMIEGITARLPFLPANVLQALYELALALPSPIDEAAWERLEQTPGRGVLVTMLVSESVLAKDWETQEEDVAWANWQDFVLDDLTATGSLPN
jgi:hypothetical protein